MVERAQRELDYQRTLAKQGRKPIPVSLADVDPYSLPEIRKRFPGLDLSQIRRLASLSK